MYKSFYGLKDNPFSLTPDSDAFFKSQAAQEAITLLLYGIESRAGFVALTGEVGVGKTTLTRYVISILPRDIKTALIFNPSLSPLELIKTINKDFDLSGRSSSKATLLNELNEFLLSLDAEGKRAVLLVDEAQNLSRECLEELRMLSNFETGKKKLIQTVLLGQTELREMLMEKSLRQLNQRISLRYHLKPLESSELAGYIDKRISVSSTDKSINFSSGVADIVYHASGGIPRMVNILCEKALMAAYMEETYIVNREHALKAVKELNGFNEPVQQASQNQTVPGPAPETRHLLARKSWRVISFLRPLYITVSLLALVTAIAFFAYEARSTAKNQDKTFQPSPAVWFDRQQGSFLTSQNANSLAVCLLNLFKKDGQYQLIDLEKKDILSIVGDDGKLMGNLILNIDELPMFAPGVVILVEPFDLLNSRYLVIKEKTGEGYMVSDPLSGTKQMSFGQLSQIWSGDAIIFWRQIPGINESDLGDGLSIRATKAMQKVLAQVGIYHGNIDGIFGLKTSIALKRFQHRHGVTPTGALDTQTYYWLSKSAYEEPLSAEGISSSWEP